MTFFMPHSSFESKKLKRNYHEFHVTIYLALVSKLKYVLRKMVEKEKFCRKFEKLFKVEHIFIPFENQPFKFQ